MYALWLGDESWGICLLPAVREAEVLREFRDAHQREPRCNTGPGT